MVDWDDFDWRKIAGLIIFALILIAGAIFVVNDKVSAQRIQQNLEVQMKALNNFQDTYQPPTSRELGLLNAQLEERKAEFAKLPLKLGDEVDVKSLETRIRNLAAAENVSLDKLEFGDETSDKFLKVYPVVISASGNMEQLSKFISGISDLKTLWRYHGQPTSSEGHIQMSLEFLAFDQNGWDQTYSCNLAVQVPQKLEVNLDKIRIFKGNLQELKSQVEALQNKMADAKKTLDDKCALERQLSALDTKIKLSRELAE